MTGRDTEVKKRKKSVHFPRDMIVSMGDSSEEDSPFKEKSPLNSKPSWKDERKQFSNQLRARAQQSDDEPKKEVQKKHAFK